VLRVIRILIVDDHEVVRRGVCSLLSLDEGIEVCGEAVDGLDAVVKAQELRPDIITMDISMPNMNGLEAAREIRRIMPDVQILILTQHDVPEMMQQALNAGANGYVVKSALSTALVAALEKVRSGQPSFVPAVYGSAQTNIDIQEILQRSAAFEKALRESEERLRMAQQVARVGTFEWNIKTGVNRWTPELEAIYGLPPGGFPGTHPAWVQLLHPDDRQETVRAVEQAIEEGAFEKEWRVIWPDGSVHWLLGRAWVFKDQQGTPQRLTGVNIDITERKVAEQDLTKKARLLDLSNDAILVRDSADRITFWSQGAIEMYGYSREEALGRVTHNLFNTKFPEPFERINEKLLRDQRWAGELLHTRQNGTKITVSSRWSVERDTQGNIVSILETNRDITEQKQAEQAQYRLAAIVESSDDAIVSKDLNGIITSWNAAAQRIFGFTSDQAIGQPITIIIPPELQDEERQILNRLRSGERVEHFETIRQTKQRMRRLVSLTISPVRDAQGRIVGASKIARDVTERKQIERLLKEAELSGRLLQLQDEERRRVARELHDGVGQLLAALNMNVTTIEREKGKLSARAARCMEENRTLVEQALTDIRTLSHLLHPPFLDEVGLVSALEEYVHGFGERSNIRVTLDVPLPMKKERLPREYEMCLFRIVQECLTNIHRHSKSATAHVRLSRIPEEVDLEVTDQGCGIDPEIQERFFAGKSTGVGLQGMRERVRQIGGALQILSNGKGTSVLVVLPIRDQAVAGSGSETLAFWNSGVLE
jgi:PAS domain S-box-containing protein